MPLDGLRLGRYHLIRLIGSGGMGEVYLAEDTLINRHIAIKVIRGEAIPDPDADVTKEANRLFQREARAIAQLNHPYILPLFDYGEEIVNSSTLTYMVMPYCQEGSLSTWVRQRGSAHPLSPQDASYIINQAAEALQYAHNQQIVHQDVKPPNFLIRGWRDSALPDLLLTDFGIAKFMAASTSTSQTIRGTPTYMAPEQWEGQPVPATDQYALAIMVYQLITGHLPFQGGPGQMMYQHLTIQPQPPSTRVPNIPPDVDSVILQSLAKKPEERFISISSFAHAFQHAWQDANTIVHTQNTLSQTLDAPTRASTQNQPKGDDIYATLALSEAEARTGTNRVLTLPGGRSVSISVPAGVQDGQTIRLEGQGEPSREGGLAGALILTVSVRRIAENPAAVLPSADRTIITGKATPIPSRDRDSDRAMVRENIPGGASYDRLTSDPGRIDTPSYSSTTIRESRPVAAPYDVPASSQRRKSSRGRGILLALLVLILLLGSSAGLYYYFVGFGSPSTTDANATATAQANATVLANNNVHGTATALANNRDATATAQANANPYPPGTGTLVLDDPLSNNTKGYQWEEGSRDGGYCTFTGGAYHSIILQAGFFHSCLALATHFTDFAFEVQATIVSGSSSGIVFRADRATTHLYYFIIDKNGNYYLKVYFDKFGNSSIVASGSSPAIHASGSNLIGVVAQGNNISLYVNRQPIKSVSDSTFSSGQVGVVALAGEVAFSNAKVWSL